MELWTNGRYTSVQLDILSIARPAKRPMSSVFFTMMQSLRLIKYYSFMLRILCWTIVIYPYSSSPPPILPAAHSPLRHSPKRIHYLWKIPSQSASIKYYSNFRYYGIFIFLCFEKREGRGTVGGELVRWLEAGGVQGHMATCVLHIFITQFRAPLIN